MNCYHNEDYTFFVYSVAEIKSKLGLTPQSRSGLFERVLANLVRENRVSILDWIIDGEEYRMLTPEDSQAVISEFYRQVPQKKKSKYTGAVETVLALVKN